MRPAGLTLPTSAVNHKILLEKLDEYGIRRNMPNLVRSYLFDRVQFTECNLIESERSKIICGVPQSSTLTFTITFLIAHNSDLPQQTKFHTNLFADDTVLILKDKNVNNLRKMVNEELQMIDNWMKFDRLSLNCTKSAFFLTGLNQKNNFLENFSINVEGSDIPCVETVTYLGIVADRDLAWTNNQSMMTKLPKQLECYQK